jgi:hypothetical protein
VYHLVIGSDFVHHLMVAGLNFVLDSYFLVDHLMTGSDFVHHLIVIGSNFFVDSDFFVDEKFKTTTIK